MCLSPRWTRWMCVSLTDPPLPTSQPPTQMEIRLQGLSPLNCWGRLMENGNWVPHMVKSVMLGRDSSHFIHISMLILILWLFPTGYTAGLVKDPSVYSGLHKINLKISDIQGEFGVYIISVSVCDCSVTANCWSRRGTAMKAASGAIGVVLATLVLLLCKRLNLSSQCTAIRTMLAFHYKLNFVLSVLLTVTLLSAVVISCKKKFTTLHTGNSSGETLLASNIEKPGTDCKVSAWEHGQTKLVIHFQIFFL